MLISTDLSAPNMNLRSSYPVSNWVDYLFSFSVTEQPGGYRQLGMHNELLWCAKLLVLIIQDSTASLLWSSLQVQHRTIVCVRVHACDYDDGATT